MDRNGRMMAETAGGITVTDMGIRVEIRVEFACGF